MKIEINGLDLTDIFERCIINFYFEKVQGPNAGTSMGGSEIIDTIKVKNCFETTIGYMSQSQYEKIVSIFKQDYLLVTYQDPETNEDVTRKMIVNAGVATQIPMLGGGYAYKNMHVNFRER